jgi:hypothetical protein
MTHEALYRERMTHATSDQCSRTLLAMREDRCSAATCPNRSKHRRTVPERSTLSTGPLRVSTGITVRDLTHFGSRHGPYCLLYLVRSTALGRVGVGGSAIVKWTRFREPVLSIYPDRYLDLRRRLAKRLSAHHGI